MRVLFFLQMLKILYRFQKCKKKLRKAFYFFDNWVWIGCVKLSLLREYLSPAVNAGTTGSKIFHISKRDVFHSTFSTVINKYDKGAVMQLSTIFGSIWYVPCRRVLQTGLFTDVSNLVFRCRKYRKYISFKGHLFVKMFKTWSIFQN